MQRAYKNNEAVGVSEMAIVNTFTKLIFGEDAYTARELAIIDGFRAIEVDVLRDSHEEMGEYLRNLGVREMIQLVSRLHRHLAGPVDIASSGPAATTSTRATGSSGAGRDNPSR
jgi:hypothetical protein